MSDTNLIFLSEKKLLAFLAKKKKSISPLLILTHDYPDPDAMASAYALQFLAHHISGVRSRIVYKGIIGRVENRNMARLLDLPVHKIKPGEIQKYAHIALIDTQPAFENNPFPEDRKATIVIDQHPSLSRPSAHLSIVDITCGATSVLLSKAVLSLKIEMPERLATALAYGIISDTLNLYRAKRPDIIKTYQRLLPFTDMHLLARIQTPIYERKYFTILRYAINNTQLWRGLMVCHLGRVSNPDIVSEIAELLLSYKQAKWVFVSGRVNNKLHISLRAKNSGIHAAPILRACVADPDDAGGHENMAGGSIKINRDTERSWKEAEMNLQNSLVKILQPGKSCCFSYPFRK